MYNKLLEILMQPIDWLIIIFPMLGAIAWLQNEASGNIGNRPYSSWYETHFLVERKGICKLIYFKPKHFGRYTLFEVACFFASFAYILIYLAIGLIWNAGLIDKNTTLAICMILAAITIIYSLIIIMINDIGSHKDRKKKFYNETGERYSQQTAELLNNTLYDTLKTGNKLVDRVMQQQFKDLSSPYYTIHSLRQSYWNMIYKAGNDAQKIEEINLQYIEYFKNIEKLVVIKKNKDGSLQLKISE